MHNPLAKLSIKLLDAILQDRYLFFVRQAYTRAIDPMDQSIKGAFLFTHYRERRDAEAHLSALYNDSYSKLYDCTQTEDRLNLNRAAQQPLGYLIYAAILNAKKWEPPLSLTPKIKSYIRKNTSWELDRGETLKIELALQFGELYLKFRHGQNEEMKIALYEIERIYIGF
ncbi:hypothetical protein KTO58_05655 [Chitinophaga pendula]|uniref:hypothetical protein n=1 Tax=Chitinophaga TaxID=79328 RepID=UPI000BB085EB|nr:MULTISPECIES: hypothetical protein [Chitinophaga]ASZ13712.1 hypothetical protein CK934_23515 [Chitinophaga sp. MD30]UCJ08671.1 hypothetical protein KTO58_05655 [Chitinophaga pendula]